VGCVIGLVVPRLNKLTSQFSVKMLVTGMILTIYVAVFQAYANAYEVGLQQPIFNTLIQFKDSGIVSTSDSVIYLGRKEHYIFLYNKKQNTPEIIFSDEVKEIKLVRNPNYKDE